MKKLIVIGSLGVLFLYRYGKKKLQDINLVLKDLSIDVIGINNPKLNNRSISFNVTIALTNNSALPLTVSTGQIIKLRKLIFKDHNNVILGESTTDISNISIAASETIIIPDIPTILPIKNIGLAINTVLNTISKVGLLKVTAELETPAGTILINE